MWTTYEPTDSWIDRHIGLIGGMLIGLIMGLSVGVMLL